MNVLLIGDSIRYGAPPNSPGYGIYVKEMLQGVANVYAPDDNCRFAEYTLRYIHDWAKEIDASSIDVIHWNNGLWDVLRLNGDEPLTPPEIYEYFLRRVYSALRMLFPNAKIIFALSTSVIEEWADPNFFRYNADIEKYNEVASRVMRELGVPINDLYAITRTFDDSLHSDWVHFGHEGSKILAEAVTQKILNV
ncbi:MAG: hypothetical protein II980_05345 [Clostridia bacterium]|nr:hypothetical protein [Clostridia bacterium]